MSRVLAGAFGVVWALAAFRGLAPAQYAGSSPLGMVLLAWVPLLAAFLAGLSFGRGRHGATATAVASSVASSEASAVASGNTVNVVVVDRAARDEVRRPWHDTSDSLPWVDVSSSAALGSSDDAALEDAARLLVDDRDLEPDTG